MERDAVKEREEMMRKEAERKARKEKNSGVGGKLLNAPVKTKIATPVVKPGSPAASTAPAVPGSLHFTSKVWKKT